MKFAPVESTTHLFDVLKGTLGNDRTREGSAVAHSSEDRKRMMKGEDDKLSLARAKLRYLRDINIFFASVR